MTIVIPVFNGANYLAAAIDSALAQTWRDIEVLVVDDGSTDAGRTRAIAEAYGDRVRLVSKPNGGVATALNAGLEAMRGQWFSWLSHDDLYHPRKIEVQMAALAAAAPGSIAFGDFDVVDAAGQHLHAVRATQGFDPDRPLWAVLEGRINGCTLLAPRALLRDAGGFHPGLPTTQDYALWFHLARRHPFVAVPGAFVAHRSHDAQGSRNARHIDEAGMLWTEMLEAVTPAEMRQHAGTEIAFLIRAQRFLAGASYLAGRAAVARLLRRRLAGVKATLVWATATTAGPAPALAALRQIGLRPDCVLADLSPDAASSLALRAGLPDGAVQIRLSPLLGLRGIFEAALVIDDAELLLIADAATPVGDDAWDDGVKAVLGGACDGWLRDAGAGEDVLPLAFRGAVLAPEAVRNALARAAALGGGDVADALGLVARLDHAAGGPGVPIPAPPAEPEPETAPPDPPPISHGPRPGLAATRLGALMLDGAIALRRAIGPGTAALFGARRLVQRRDYLEVNPDVALAAADPTLHYLRHGWREGRDPRPVEPPRPGPLLKPENTPPVPAADVAPEPAPPAIPAPAMPAAPGPAWLLVLHAHGGGTLQYAERLASLLRRRGLRPVFAWGLENRVLACSTIAADREERRFMLPAELDAAVDWLRAQGAIRVDVLHAMGLEDHIQPLLRALGRPYDVTFVDYHLVCTTPHLLRGAEVSLARGQPDETTDLASQLRPAPHPLVQGAARRLACSRDLAARLERLVPGIGARPVYPPESARPERFRVTPPPPIAAGEAMRVLLIGHMMAHKGRDEVLAVATEARRRGLALEFHHLGESAPPVPPAVQRDAALFLHGYFEPGTLTALIAAIGPHLAWFPAHAPETYGFTLSEAMLAGLPILARGLGAYPERLAGRAFTWVVPPAEASVDTWLDRLAALRDSNLAPPAEAGPPLGLPPLAEDFYARDYLEPGEAPA